MLPRNHKKMTPLTLVRAEWPSTPEAVQTLKTLTPSSSCSTTASAQLSSYVGHRIRIVAFQIEQNIGFCDGSRLRHAAPSESKLRLVMCAERNIAFSSTTTAVITGREKATEREFSASIKRTFILI